MHKAKSRSNQSTPPIQPHLDDVQYMYIIARVGGQYRRIIIRFMAGSIGPTVGRANTEAQVLPDLRSAIIYSLYDPALASSIDGPGSGLEWKQ